MSGKNTSFPASPVPDPRPEIRDLSLFLEKDGRVRLLSTPTSDCMTALVAERRRNQFERGAVALAIFASVSEAMKKSLTTSCPFFLLSSSLTFAIIMGMLMSTGQISLQSPQETHSCAK